MTFQTIINEIENNLKKILQDLSISDISFSVEVAKPGFGDVSSNIAFLLAKELKKSPKEITQIISEKYSQCPNVLVLKSEGHPSGYLNFFADWPKLTKLILSESYFDTYGDIDIGKNSDIVVEHTSVNPNKALHIGHIRNIVVGDTISRILKKANYKVKVLNYIDDSGLQVADIIVGFKHFGFDEEPPNGKKFDHYCGDDVYVKTTQKYELDPSLEEVRKNTLKELEDGDSEIAKFGDLITRKVLSGQLQTCWNLNVSYDCLNFESQIIRSGLWLKIFEKLKDMGLIEFENSGKNAQCWVIRGDGKEEDKVIVRYYKDAPRWFYPESKAYEIVELVYSRQLPFSKALEFNIKKSDDNEILDLKMGLHQYIYNIGDSPVDFNWKTNNIVNHDKINPGDSLYVKPFVPHNFRSQGKLMVLRIAGRIAGEGQREFSRLDKEDAHRAILETSMWFDPKGKN